VGCPRSRARNARGNHATATMSICSPTRTVSAGTTTVRPTRSPGPATGAGAASSSARASGPSRASTPPGALSTTSVIASVATTTSPWRARTGPITIRPNRSARSCSSRSVTRTGSPALLIVTSVSSREPTIANPVSGGSIRLTGSLERVCARMVSTTASPTGSRVRSTAAVTSGAPACSRRTRTAITSLSRAGECRAAAA
jgi:hypothetical protein